MGAVTSSMVRLISLRGFGKAVTGGVGELPGRAARLGACGAAVAAPATSPLTLAGVVAVTGVGNSLAAAKDVGAGAGEVGLAF